MSIILSQSDPSLLTCGVPQDSILGSLLVMIWKLVLVRKVNYYCILTTVPFFFSHKEPETISRKLGSELESCSRWMVETNCLCIRGRLSVFYLDQRKN